MKSWPRDSWPPLEASFNGARLPFAGTAPTPIILKREGPLGPCKATVVTDSYRRESGEQTFRVTETWEPPHAGYGTITEITVFDTVEAAREHAGRAAHQWQQGTARSERLAPHGQLRAPGRTVQSAVHLKPR